MRQGSTLAPRAGPPGPGCSIFLSTLGAAPSERGMMIHTLAALARRALALPLGSVAPPTPSAPAGTGGKGEFARLMRPAAGPASARAAPPREDDPLPGRHDLAEGACPSSCGTAVPAAAPPLFTAQPTPEPATPAGATSAQARGAVALQELWPALVRRVAWDGDSRRAAMRLELGAGALAGAVLLLRYDEGHVRVTLSDPSGADLDAWRARIAARLAAAGLQVEGVE